MFRKIQTIHFLSAAILLCLVSLPIINLALSWTTDLPSGIITRRLEDPDLSWIVEGLLIASVLSHLIAAIKLKNRWLGKEVSTWQWGRLFAGFYGAVFLLIHVICVSAGRIISALDTGFYSGVAGMNTDPLRIAFMIYGLLFAVFFCAQFICCLYTRSLHFLTGLTNGKAELRP